MIIGIAHPSMSEVGDSLYIDYSVWKILFKKLKSFQKNYVDKLTTSDTTKLKISVK